VAHIEERKRVRVRDVADCGGCHRRCSVRRSRLKLFGLPANSIT